MLRDILECMIRNGQWAESKRQGLLTAQCQKF